MREYFWALRTKIFGWPYAIYSAVRQKKTYTLHNAPRSFPRAFWRTFPFLHTLTKVCSSNLPVLTTSWVLAKYPQSPVIFGPSFEQHCIFLKTDLLRQKAKRDPGETENCSRKPSESYVTDLQECISVFSTVQPSKTGTIGPDFSFESRKIFFPIVVRRSKVTTLPRIFIRVVCRFNSFAFAAQRLLAYFLVIVPCID